ncbi:hypothetical protein HKD37_20G056310 [Glycine soja]
MNDNIVIWFCSLHDKSNNYLKVIINSVLNGFNDIQGSKCKAPVKWIAVKCNKQRGNVGYDYYVMHWMSTIYFIDPRPFELERLKLICIYWARFYVKVKNETIDV